MTPANAAQLVNYLAATGIETGLLLNFGAERLEFRRKTRTYRPPATAVPEVTDESDCRATARLSSLTDR